MVIETYYIGAYWGRRKESLDQCALSAAQALSELGQCDPLFSKWFELGFSRAEALAHEVEPSIDKVGSLLRSGQSKRYTDKSVITEAGYFFSLWTGGPDNEAANVTVRCGADSPYITNVFLLNLPAEGKVADRLLQVNALKRLLAVIARTFSPDWAVVNSYPHLKARGRKARGKGAGPEVGWLTYLNSRLGTVPTLAGPARVESIAGGSLIILTEERFSFDREDHIDIAEGITDRLEKNGTF